MGVKSGIERIDTNLLIRLIVRDDPKKLKKVLKLLSNKKKRFVFEEAAMMEVVFVLSGDPYNYNREKIAKKVQTILKIPNLFCNNAVMGDVFDLYVKHPKLSFVDCYLWVKAGISQEVPLWTFDHKLATQCPVAKEP